MTFLKQLIVFQALTLEWSLLFSLDKKGVELCKIINYKDGITNEALRPLLETGSDVFIRNNNSVNIYKKVKNLNEDTYSKKVSSQKPLV